MFQLRLFSSSFYHKNCDGLWNVAYNRLEQQSKEKKMEWFEKEEKETERKRKETRKKKKTDK